MPIDTIRLKRSVVRAAELLEREAAALKASHVVRGLWGTDQCDKDAAVDYREMLKIAQDLRAYAWPT